MSKNNRTLLISVIVGLFCGLFYYHYMTTKEVPISKQVEEIKQEVKTKQTNYIKKVNENKIKEESVGRDAVLQTDNINDDGIVDSFNELINRARIYNENCRNKD